MPDQTADTGHGQPDAQRLRSLAESLTYALGGQLADQVCPDVDATAVHREAAAFLWGPRVSPPQEIGHLRLSICGCCGIATHDVIDGKCPECRSEDKEIAKADRVVTRLRLDVERKRMERSERA